MGEYDGIRVRADLLGLYETPVLHGHLADSQALTAALAAAIRRSARPTPASRGPMSVAGTRPPTCWAPAEWGGAAPPPRRWRRRR